MRSLPRLSSAPRGGTLHACEYSQPCLTRGSSRWLSPGRGGTRIGSDRDGTGERLPLQRLQIFEEGFLVLRRERNAIFVAATAATGVSVFATSRLVCPLRLACAGILFETDI